MEELSATLSHEELAEWRAYYDVEPFGTQVEDDRFRNLLALTYAGLGGKEDIRWLDRDPEWTAHLEELSRPPLDDSVETYFEARLARQAVAPEPQPDAATSA